MTIEQQLLWKPSCEQIRSSNIARFLYQHGLRDLEQLQQKSNRDPEWFYPAILEQLDIRWYHPYKQVIDQSNGPEWAEWFRGGSTNLYTYCIEKHVQAGHGHKTAIVWENENGRTRQLNYMELDRAVCRLAAGLKSLGIRQGNRIGIFLPVVVEAPVALFACAKIGAVAIPIFSGYAAEAVATRLQDCEAKLIITADGYYRKGQYMTLKETADQVCEMLPTVRHVVVLRHTERDIPWMESRDRWYHDITATSQKTETVPCQSDDPFMILYTSGTTGQPKGTVHTHTGFPIKSALDMFFCFDVKPSDHMFWLTDNGWMMAPWLYLGTTILGASMVLYEGSPDFPSRDRLWDLIERHRITIFGIAPAVIRSLMQEKDFPRHDLTSLRILGSAGEAWDANSWSWFFTHIGKKRCPVINYSGGTEVSGGILGCYPIKPLKPCSFHGPIPGMAAEVVDQNGKAVHDTVGELVLTRPSLGMTRSFWNDDQRYLKTYWLQRENVWIHGDLAKIDQEGYWYIQGRSDDTLKVAGKRIGPSEIESAITSHTYVKEAAVIGVPDNLKGEVPVAFIVLHTGATKTIDLRQDIMATVANKLGKAMKPYDIHFIGELPRTLSNKVPRRLIRMQYLLQPLGDISTLQNPQVLKNIKPQKMIAQR